MALIKVYSFGQSMNTITEVTRQAIMDYLSMGIQWSGRLTDHEFLSRIYDLTRMPSTDGRISNALGDIRQHRTNWNDWPADWVFTDPRFNLLWAPDDEFLKFLCETVHPVIRPDEKTAREMVEEYHKRLKNDGWELFEKANISGSPVFGARKIGTRVSIVDEPTGWEKVDRQIQEIKYRLDTAQTEEHYQAIGLLSREVLISLAEATYDIEKYPPLDGTVPSRTDAWRMLESIIETTLRGGTNEEARSHAKSALKLALALQHKRNANYKMAAICAEATMSVVNLVTILCKEVNL